MFRSTVIFRSIRSRPWQRRRAFTLFELLIVMGIMIALVAAVGPSFSGLLQSARYANAVNTLNATLSRARSIAIQRSRPSGVVFLFDIETRRTTMMIVQLHSAAYGSLVDQLGDVVGIPDTDGFVLVPAENTAVVQLPKEVLVYGLSFHHEVALPPYDENDWYYQAANGEQYFAPYYGEVLNHPDRPERLVNPWLLPHNDPRLYISTEDDLDPAFFRSPDKVNLEDFWSLLDPDAEKIDGILFDDADVRRAVLNAHSFVIMFGEDGVLKPITDTGTISNDADYYLEFPDLPRDREPTAVDEDFVPYDKISPKDLQTNFNPSELGQGIDINVYTPNPEVMLRPADMLAVVELNQFIKGTGITEPWGLHSAGAFAPWTDFRGTPLTAASPIPPDDDLLDELVVRVSDWIDINANIIAFDPNSGTPQKRSVN